MLIRISGAKSGVVEYLRTGKKQGRRESRNELDERYILSGDLEVVAKLLEGIPGSGEKYLHITLSFREPHVPEETLQAIIQEFKEFALAAHQDGSAYFYAEAHRPRLKALHDVRTMEPVERFPHIHVVIPKVNLLSRQGLNPFGKVSRVVPYIDAFQEMINSKYGLESPKDHPRVQPTDRSDILSRIKGDHFEGLGKEVKREILAEILKKDIRTTEELSRILLARGEVKVRNQGTPGAYFNIKMPGNAKGINLKDQVFTQDFLSMDPERKLMVLGLSSPKVHSIKERPRSPQIQRALEEWFFFKAKEIRYLNSGNRTLWKEYQNADESGKITILNRLEESFRNRFISHEDTTLLKTPWNPTPRQAERPPILPLSESELGQRVKVAHSHRVHQQMAFIVSRRFRISTWNLLWEDLERNHGLSSEDCKEQQSKVKTPQAQLEFLVEQMHWDHRSAWRYLKRFGSFRPYPEKVSEWAHLRKQEVDQRNALWTAYLEEKSMLYKKSLRDKEYKPKLALLQMSFVLKSQELWIQSHWQRSRLLDQTISSPESKLSAIELALPPAWSYQVGKNQETEYRYNQTKVMTDTGRILKIHNTGVAVLETSLRLAILKFGHQLHVEGSDDFKRALVQTAAKMKLRVTFDDPEMEKLKEQLVVERERSLSNHGY